MAEDKKISGLPLATTPLAGTEEQEIIQGGVNKRVAVSNVGGSGAAASETTPGIAEIATQAETDTGTDDARIVTPLKLANYSKWNTKLDALVTLRTETATHDLDATDLASINAGDQLMIQLNIAVAGNLEIPTNANQAFPIGTTIGWMQYGAGQITIVPLSGVTMRSANNANKSFAQYSKGYIEKIATDEWVLSGDITV